MRILRPALVDPGLLVDLAAVARCARDDCRPSATERLQNRHAICASIVGGPSSAKEETRARVRARNPAWVELSSPAPDASAAFYGELMGWQATEPDWVEETFHSGPAPALPPRATTVPQLMPPMPLRPFVYLALRVLAPAGR
jgi:hypothetical protein